jgi:hypothetical protein
MPPFYNFFSFGTETETETATCTGATNNSLLSSSTSGLVPTSHIVSSSQQHVPSITPYESIQQMCSSWAVYGLTCSEIKVPASTFAELLKIYNPNQQPHDIIFTTKFGPIKIITDRDIKFNLDKYMETVD